MNMTPTSATAVTLADTPQRPDRDAKLMDAAQRLEATFLAEMLKSTGFGDASDAFGGGPGEEQFSSYLRQAQADQMVKAGGIGLAEALFESLKERADGNI